MGTYQAMLQALREDLEQAQRRLEQLIAMKADATETDASGPAAEHEQAAFLDAVLRSRRALEGALGQGNFSDPRRDMLIELYLSSLKDRAVSVSELGVAAAVPHATALRHIQQLSDEGLILRIPDPTDGRRTYVRLTARAEAEMRDWTLMTRHALQKAIA